MSYTTAKIIVEVISFSRYSCKLALYLATGRQFRKHLVKLIFHCNKQLNRQWSNTTVTSIATRTNSYKPSAEKATLLSLSNGRVPTVESISSKYPSTKLNSLTRERVSWSVGPSVESLTPQDEPCESCFILNNNNNDYVVD